MIRHSRLREFDGDSDAVALAGQIVALMDTSPDHAAAFEVPIDGSATPELIQWWEDRMLSAYNAARRRRPSLALRLHYRPLTPTSPARCLMEIHEHRWVDGVCVRGCGMDHAR